MLVEHMWLERGKIIIVDLVLKYILARSVVDGVQNRRLFKRRSVFLCLITICGWVSVFAQLHICYHLVFTAWWSDLWWLHDDDRGYSKIQSQRRIKQYIIIVSCSHHCLDIKPINLLSRYSQMLFLTYVRVWPQAGDVTQPPHAL
jgi:hypothetical protein